MSHTSASSVRIFPEGAADRQGLRAGLISRLGAMVIDAAYAMALLGVGYVAFAGLRFMRDARRFTWPQPTFELALGVGAVVVVLMLTIAWSSTGRSGGMRLMGLRLVGRDGAGIGVPVAFLRAVACVVFPLGLFWSAVSRRNASLQDLLFGTSVIYDWTVHVPPAQGDEDAPRDAAMRA